MTNVVAQYWEIAGESLHTFGTTVTNLGGDLTGGVPMRGENLIVPNRPGAIWRPKVPDQRVLTLGFTVTGLRPDGTAEPTAELERARFNENLAAVRRLLWTDTAYPRPITKRVLRINPADPTGPPNVFVRTGLAEFAGGLEPVSESDNVATFTVDLLMADPFFYGDVQAYMATIAEPINDLTNDGDAAVTGSWAYLTLYGPLTNPEVWVDGSYSLRLGLSIAAGDAIFVDLDDWTAIRSSDSANVIGALTYSGSRYLLPIPTGVTSFELSGSGSGAAVLSFRAPYL